MPELVHRPPVLPQLRTGQVTFKSSIVPRPKRGILEAGRQRSLNQRHRSAPAICAIITTFLHSSRIGSCGLEEKVRNTLQQESRIRREFKHNSCLVPPKHISNFALLLWVTDFAFFELQVQDALHTRCPVTSQHIVRRRFALDHVLAAAKLPLFPCITRSKSR